MHVFELFMAGSCICITRPIRRRLAVTSPGRHPASVYLSVVGEIAINRIWDYYVELITPSAVRKSLSTTGNVAPGFTLTCNTFAKPQIEQIRRHAIFDNKILFAF
ncbi:hypothetical protein Zmor_000145 [Zophobas morio]|uniref:Uncharacterized protein n=1 Tax=Zophobas morio TaxID=2755281 RepID=A0AA38J4V3_9CUCU|nr:hypothetical protein Zmor_000145 [Zophobas morio]